MFMRPAVCAYRNNRAITGRVTNSWGKGIGIWYAKTYRQIGKDGWDIIEEGYQAAQVMV